MQQAKPYVYKGVHRETGEFYIGFRSANKEPWEIDLPKYRTSSKLVRPRFDEFDWQVLMIFEKPECAYDFEQYMIHEAWGDPLLLNKACHWGNKIRFSTSGVRYSEEHKAKLRKTYTAERRAKIRQTHLGRKHSAEACEKIRQARLGDNHRLGTKHSAETREKIRQANLGRVPSAESREKMRLAHLGKTCEGSRQAHLGNTYRLGKTHSDATREKMRQAYRREIHVGKKVSEETREKLRQAH